MSFHKLQEKQLRITEIEAILENDLYEDIKQEVELIKELEELKDNQKVTTVALVERENTEENLDNENQEIEENVDQMDTEDIDQPEMEVNVENPVPEVYPVRRIRTLRSFFSV